MERVVLGVFTFEMGGLAAWVQALGSIGAIFAGYFFISIQRKHDKTDRDTQLHEARVNDLSVILTCMYAMRAQGRSLEHERTKEIKFPVAASKLRTAKAALQMHVGTLQGFAISSKLEPKAAAHIYGAIQTALNLEVLIDAISISNSYDFNNVRAHNQIISSFNRNISALSLYKVELELDPNAEFPNEKQIDEALKDPRWNKTVDN